MPPPELVDCLTDLRTIFGGLTLPILSSYYITIHTEENEALLIVYPRFYYMVCEPRSRLKPWYHIGLHITKTAFFHLWNSVRNYTSLSPSSSEMLVQAFVASRLNYCNAAQCRVPTSYSMYQTQLLGLSPTKDHVNTSNPYSKCYTGFLFSSIDASSGL